MGNNPSNFSSVGENAPVEQVSWTECQEFCRKANVKLLTEAQWEYACRAGFTGPFNLGENITSEQVNYDGNNPYAGGSKGEYREKTVVCGSLPNENAWGCYDFHGNVWEWCQDRCDYNSGVVTDTFIDNISDPECRNGSSFVFWGGSLADFAHDCRSSSRFSREPGDRYRDLGFCCFCIPTD